MVSVLAFIIIALIILSIAGEWSRSSKQKQGAKKLADSKSKLTSVPKLTPEKQRESRKKSEYYQNLYGD